MPFSGLHVTCCTVYTPDPGDGLLPARLKWSQLMATAGTAAKSVPDPSVHLLRVRASADSYVAIGPAPDAVNDGARFFVQAYSDYDFYAQPGDKLAWVAA